MGARWQSGMTAPTNCSSAYLDGEVSAAEGEQIAGLLASSPAYASRLDALRELQEALHDLPRYPLPPKLGTRIMRKIACLVVDRSAGGAFPNVDSELLSAYLDGEVLEEERQPAEQASAEQALADNAAARSRLESLHLMND